MDSIKDAKKERFWEKFYEKIGEGLTEEIVKYFEVTLCVFSIALNLTLLRKKFLLIFQTDATAEINGRNYYGAVNIANVMHMIYSHYKELTKERLTIKYYQGSCAFPSELKIYPGAEYSVTADGVYPVVFRQKVVLSDDITHDIPTIHEVKKW